jgi:CubicO group peptidase (beta-lactamase class C family)
MSSDPTRRLAEAPVPGLGPVRRRVCDRLASEQGVPGMSIAVVDEHGVIRAEAVGCAELAPRRPATPLTAYLWFSMTKLVTATAALRLAAEGRLDLDAPVSHFRLGLGGPASVHGPRVRQLLNHTAGLANPLPITWIRRAEEQGPAAFAQRRLARRYWRRHPIGGTARYSNLGFLALAAIIAEVAGQSFEDYVHSAILEPTGMHRTGFGYRPDADRATGYLRTPAAATPIVKALLPTGIVGKRHANQLSFHPFLVNGSGYGGLVGDVIDAARFAALHLADGSIDGRRILPPTMAKRMRAIDTPGRPVDLGWAWYRPHKIPPGHPEFVEHRGGGGGFHSVMRLYPGLHRAIVIMSNTTRSIDLDSAAVQLLELS